MFAQSEIRWIISIITSSPAHITHCHLMVRVPPYRYRLKWYLGYGAIFSLWSPNLATFPQLHLVSVSQKSQKCLPLQQCCGSGSAWIRIKLKGSIRIRIRIEVIGWIQIRIILQMTSKNVPMEYEPIILEHFFKVEPLFGARIRIRIYI